MKTAAAWIKRLPQPRSLRYQLLVRSLLILAALLLTIGIFQYVLMKNFLYQNKAEALETQLMTMPRELMNRSGTPWNNSFGENGKAQDETPPTTGEQRRPIFFLGDSSFAYIAPDGTFTDLSGDNGGSKASPQLSADDYLQLRSDHLETSKTEYQVVRDKNGTEQLIVFRHSGSPGNSGGGLLQLGTETAPLKAVLVRQLRTFLFLSLFAFLAGLALYLPVLRRTLIPLSNMAKAVQRTDAGNLTERVPEHQGQEEIDRLSVSYNGMLERLETSFTAEREAREQMRRFIADASHELRTPLTSIHGFLEVLLRGAADKPEQLYPALNSMHGESKRIKKLVEDLLLLAKLDRAPQLQIKETRLDKLVLEMEPHLQMLAGNRSVRFQLNEAEAMCDSDKIKQVILNLFHNAVQHTDANKGVITLSVSPAGELAELAVRDNGTGIAPEHLSHVFERFYRSDSSRTRKYGGAGLGLSISKSLVEAHGGSISVESKSGEGTVFRLALPKQVEA
ncbi:sensor histidine kinase [Gorillibacterium massiliense]|uniref:sensor histidine kinase n=1 Tax=Gorillibacterium massiliense TaxID=1280390 RepID=UPI0004BA3DAD|nr:HAMP domain-containing sensor histidine kinase [Gorillibacterium massiliense]